MQAQEVFYEISKEYPVKIYYVFIVCIHFTGFISVSYTHLLSQTMKEGTWERAVYHEFNQLTVGLLGFGAVSYTHLGYGNVHDKY